MIPLSAKCIGLLVLACALFGLASVTSTATAALSATPPASLPHTATIVAPTALSTPSSPTGSPVSSATPTLSNSEHFSTRLANTRAAFQKTQTNAPTVDFTRASAERATSSARAIQKCLDAGVQTPRDWTIVACDYFVANTNRWHTGNIKSSRATGSMGVRNGVYRIELTSPGSIVQRGGPSKPAVKDFYVSVMTHPVEGELVFGSGFYFRENNENFYMFALRNDGIFTVDLLANDEWTHLLDGSAAAATKTGAYNRVSIEAQGDRFAFYVNDRLVGTMQDSTLSSGRVGVVVDIPKSNARGIFEFDDFLLLQPNPKSKARPTIPVTQNAVPPTVAPQSAPTTVPPPQPTEPPSNGCPLDPGNAGLYVINQFGGLMTLTLLDHEYRIEPNTEQLVQVPGGQEFTVSVSVQGVGKTNFGPLTLQAGECFQYRPTSSD